MRQLVHEVLPGTSEEFPGELPQCLCTRTKTGDAARGRFHRRLLQRDAGEAAGAAGEGPRHPGPCPTTKAQLQCCRSQCGSVIDQARAHPAQQLELHTPQPLLQVAPRATAVLNSVRSRCISGILKALAQAPHGGALAAQRLARLGRAPARKLPGLLRRPEVLARRAARLALAAEELAPGALMPECCLDVLRMALEIAPALPQGGLLLPQTCCVFTSYLQVLQDPVVLYRIPLQPRGAFALCL
mmetsp:Transcript_105166/g.307381  ORF Transcript_105166/g.307381 Transcript_105166/m.307381 type:complete len:243 (-) Transcript_105166:2394-3122(-)